MNGRIFLSAIVCASALLLSAPLWAAATATAAPTAQSGGAAVSAATVNVNSATVAELEALPGIGRKTADAIVAYRTEKGKFKSVQDLLKVKGIGPKSLDKIKNLVRVD